jgi:hypothetical protein
VVGPAPLYNKANGIGAHFRRFVVQGRKRSGDGSAGSFWARYCQGKPWKRISRRRSLSIRAGHPSFRRTRRPAERSPQRRGDPSARDRPSRPGCPAGSYLTSRHRRRRSSGALEGIVAGLGSRLTGVHDALARIGPVGAKDVASELDCCYETAYRKLRVLEDDGRVSIPRDRERPTVVRDRRGRRMSGYTTATQRPVGRRSGEGRTPGRSVRSPTRRTHREGVISSWGYHDVVYTNESEFSK